MLFFETSAKTSHNIEEVFSTSAKEISKKIDSGYYDLGSDTCGIKKGMNSNLINNLKLEEKNKLADHKSKCC
jgi:hypothetical protein